MEVGIIKELDKEYIEAVKNYEESIVDINRKTSIDSFINLAFLYWCFAFEFFEFNIPNNISEEWSFIGGERYPEILELGLFEFPDNVELHFWKKYFSHISYGENFSKQDCLGLIKRYGDAISNVPYFFLFQFDKELYKAEKEKLVAECETLSTAKNLYIKSILS